MDVDTTMAVLIGGLGLVAWGFRGLSEGMNGDDYAIPMLVVGILISVALIADAVLLATGVMHVADWRVGKTYLRGAGGVLGVAFLVPMLVGALRARRRPP